jgi:hypothetical protein
MSLTNIDKYASFLLLSFYISSVLCVNMPPIAVQRDWHGWFFRHNERTTLKDKGNSGDSSAKWMGRGRKNALKHREHVYLIL